MQSISDSSIRQIASNCHNLQNLCVSKCAELTDLSLMALSQNNPFLNTLEVSGCRNFTDLGFQALGKNCKYLERMDLEECNQITDLTLAHLATGCPSLEKLVKLFHLNSILYSFFFLYFIASQSFKNVFLIVFIALWTDNGWWYTPAGCRQLCCRKLIRPWIG